MRSHRGLAGGVPRGVPGAELILPCMCLGSIMPGGNSVTSVLQKLQLSVNMVSSSFKLLRHSTLLNNLSLSGSRRKDMDACLVRREPTDSTAQRSPKSLTSMKQSCTVGYQQKAKHNNYNVTARFRYGKPEKVRHTIRPVNYQPLGQGCIQKMNY